MKKPCVKSVLCYTAMLCVFASVISVFVGLAMKNINLCFVSIFAGYASLMLFFSFVFGLKDKEDSRE